MPAPAEPWAALRDVAVQISGVAPALGLVDGSLRNAEWVAGFSDLDLKVWLLADDDETFRHAVSTARAALESSELARTVNLWLQRSSEFPGAYPGNGFDFVQRGVLQNAIVLLGRDRRADIRLPPSIGEYECLQVEDSLARFATRLRRAAVKPASQEK